jgi:hypothetical protein
MLTWLIPTWVWIIAAVFITVLVMRWFSGPRPAREYVGIPEGNAMIKRLFSGLEDVISGISKSPPAAQTFTPPLHNESRGERTCRQALEYMFQQPFPRCRPDFMRNPETGRNFELDCYSAPLKFAVEYNGPHHLEGSVEEVYKTAKRDEQKLDMADAAGVFVLTVQQSGPHAVRHHDIPRYIYDNLPTSILPFVVNVP